VLSNMRIFDTLDLTAGKAACAAIKAPSLTGYKSFCEDRLESHWGVFAKAEPTEGVAEQSRAAVMRELVSSSLYSSGLTKLLSIAAADPRVRAAVMGGAAIAGAASIAMQAGGAFM
jgi:hypothetical protein